MNYSIPGSYKNTNSIVRYEIVPEFRSISGDDILNDLLPADYIIQP